MMMDKPTFDCDGYPTDETLDAIRKWNVHDNESIASLLTFVEQAWRYTFKLETGTDELGKHWLRTATCGWSGNEDLIRAIQDNTCFWTFCWLESRRGGSYKFITNPFVK